jgi:hypothetical protein
VLDTLELHICGECELTMTPTANVWISREHGLNRAVEKVSGWLRTHGTGYANRATLIPIKGELSEAEPALAEFISNGNVGSLKGKAAMAGGPVLVLGPTLELLETAIRLADGHALGLVEHIPGLRP